MFSTLANGIRINYRTNIPSALLIRVNLTRLSYLNQFRLPLRRTQTSVNDQECRTEGRLRELPPLDPAAMVGLFSNVIKITSTLILYTERVRTYSSLTAVLRNM